MGLVDRYVVCRGNGARSLGDGFVLRSSAQRMADEMNRTAVMFSATAVAGYHVHHESELDEDGLLCPCRF